MRNRLIAFFAAFFLSCFHIFLHAEIIEEPLPDFTIDSAIQTAFNNNKSIQMQEANIKKAAANKLYAISNFLPKVDTNYNYTHYDKLYSISSPNVKQDSRTFIGYRDDNLAGVTVEQDLFKGGAHVATFKQSDLELLSQRETYRATILEVEFETKRFFYGLLLAYEIARIARSLVEQAQAHYQEVLARFNQGTASKFDVLQSKVHVSLVVPQLVDAESSIEDIKVEFKKLLVLDMQKGLKIKGELAFNPIKITEESFLKEAMEHRPEMILKSLGVDIEKWAIEFAKSTGLPQLTGNFEYFGRYNNLSRLMQANHDNWSIGLKATIPIFDGLATPAKINEARAQYKYAKLDKENYINQMAVDITKICLDLRKAHAIIDAQKDSVVEAKEALRLAEVRYNTGVGINLDVLDAQVALAQVEQSLAEATYDYIMAKANLNRTMGRELAREIE